jgi:hypothetical protein
MFIIDQTDLKRLEHFLKNAPKQEFPNAVRNILNSLAFRKKEIDAEVIAKNMIVRNMGFVKSSLQVEQAKRGPINSMVAYEGSIKRDRFSGWKEQQSGGTPSRKRIMTNQARGGNIRAQVKQKARLKSSNKFYKPEQFQGRSLQSSFQFMMRVLGSRGGGEFIIDKQIPIKRGYLGKGLYSLKNHRITKLQDFEKAPNIKKLNWNNISIDKLYNSNDVKKIWQRQLEFIINKYK